MFTHVQSKQRVEGYTTEQSDSVWREHLKIFSFTYRFLKHCKRKTGSKGHRNKEQKTTTLVHCCAFVTAFWVTARALLSGLLLEQTHIKKMLLLFCIFFYIFTLYCLSDIINLITSSQQAE